MQVIDCVFALGPHLMIESCNESDIDVDSKDTKHDTQ